MDKNSFIFYLNWAKMMLKLDSETKCDLIDAVCNYELGNEVSFTTPTAEAIFESMEKILQRDAEKYQKRVEKAKQAAEKRWQNKQDDANASPSNAHECERISKHSDNDNVNDNVNDNDNDNVNVNDNVINISNTTTLSKQSNISSSSTSDENVIVEVYNSTDFPKVRALSAQRKKAIKARLKTFSKNDIIQAINIAAMSSFLNGNNDRNWRADFDWIFGVKSGGDQHLTRILEGHYSGNSRNGNWMSRLAAEVGGIVNDSS